MNTINIKKLNVLETLYRRAVYHDPHENRKVTRWLWCKLSAMYDTMEDDF